MFLLKIKLIGCMLFIDESPGFSGLGLILGYFSSVSFVIYDHFFSQQLNFCLRLYFGFIMHLSYA